MIEKKEDRRIHHTKRFLREALLSLLQEKSIAKITTTELCRKADINRNTFYSHYSYPEDVLREMQEEILNMIQDLFENSIHENSHPVCDICILLKNHPDLSYVLFNHADQQFTELLVRLCHEKNIHDWKKISRYTDEVTAERFYRFALSGATTIIRNWCNDGFKESPESIAEFIENVSLEGMKGLMHS